MGIRRDLREKRASRIPDGLSANILRFERLMVNDLSLVQSCSLIRVFSKTKELRLSQPLNVRPSRFFGHLKEDIVSISNLPPTWRYFRLGGQSSPEPSSVIKVEEGSSSDSNLLRLLMAFLKAESAIGSTTKLRQRCESSLHLDKGARLFILK